MLVAHNSAPILQKFIHFYSCILCFLHGFVVEYISIIVIMASVNKKHLSENEILELLDVDSDSICTETSVEKCSKKMTVTKIILDCNKTSGKL